MLSNFRYIILNTFSFIWCGICYYYINNSILKHDCINFLEVVPISYNDLFIFSNVLLDGVSLFWRKIGRFKLLHAYDATLHPYFIIKKRLRVCLIIILENIFNIFNT